MSTELLAVRPDRELTNGETELLFHLLPPERRERLLRQFDEAAAELLFLGMTAEELARRVDLRADGGRM